MQSNHGTYIRGLFCVLVFAAAGHSTRTRPSFALSQKHELLECSPAPFCCMMIHDTAGCGRSISWEPPWGYCSNPTCVFKRLLHFQQALHAPVANLIHPCRNFGIFVKLVLEDCIDHCLEDRLDLLDEEGRLNREAYRQPGVRYGRN